MNKKNNSICPFGEDLQKYWDKRYQYFSKFDEGIEIDAEGLYSVTPQEVADKQASIIKGDNVLDGFCGVGGNAIAFARAGKRVITVDTNQKRLNMARNNAIIYGVEDKITFICDDIFNVMNNVTAQAVYLDPPWGGPEYKILGKFLLEHFSLDGNKLLKIALDNFTEVILQVPIIFDFTEMTKLDNKYKVLDDISDGRVISKTIIFNNSKTN